MTESLVNFKDMCAKFDVTPRTLRYYEYIELLSPKREGRTRMYTPRDVARMKLIMRGRRWGFSLEELRQWLMIYDNEGTQAQLEAWLPLAAEKKAELERRQKEIAVVLEELNTMMANVQADLNKA
ncbi:MAG: MerR family transcriptional regulator [Planktomarina sp.]